MADPAWIEMFPGLAAVSEDVRRALVSNTRVLRVPKGTVVFGPGSPAQNMLLLLDGSVRVQQTSDTGREIVLYRVEAGQSCVMTTSCLLAHDTYSAEGIAETDVVAAAIPSSAFHDLLARSDPFRRFVFSAFSRRISDLFHLVEEVAFGRIDMRLADRLVTLARGGDSISITHQNLATELGTAREVVSRQLHEFQRRGWVSQARGRIDIANHEALQALATTA